jgi:hypothetical protein
MALSDYADPPRFPHSAEYARIYETEAEALADAKRRVDRLFCLA